MMKKIVTLILLGVLSLACMTAAAQNTPSANAKNHAQQRQAMMLQKKEFIQSNFELKTEQSTDFWAAYDKYSATELQIHKEQRSMLDKAGVPHFGDTTAMTDEQILEKYRIGLWTKRKMVEADETFFNDLKKVLVPQQIDRYYKLEKKFLRTVVSRKDGKKNDTK